MTEHRWFHVTARKIERFTGSDGIEIPCLIAGDTYKMCEGDAIKLQDQGAGIIHTATIPDRVVFRRASEPEVK